MRNSLKYSMLILVMALNIVVTGHATTPTPKAELARIAIDTTFYQTVEIDHTKNQICDSSKSLYPLIGQIKQLRTDSNKVITILHIGDSHLQAGYLSNTLRTLLQSEFGDAGQGLIMPLRLAETNQPPGYDITSPNDWQSAKCTDSRLTEPVGVSGLDIMSSDNTYQFSISSQSEFCIVRTFHHAKAPALYETENYTQSTYCPQRNSPNSTTIMLNHDVTSVDLEGQNDEEHNTGCFYGFSLENGRKGVLYHAAGVNGATFNNYNTNSEFASQSAQLSPNLVLVSLGTNDAYGANFDSVATRSHVTQFIQSIKMHNPNAAIIVTTPLASCRKAYHKRIVRYLVNPNVLSMSAIIISVCAENGVAYWDTYNICGGKTTIEKWKRAGLFQKDMLHLTVPGYELQATLFFEAFSNYYNSLL